MPAYETYGQTDVMHDPNYVRTLLTSHDPRQRAQGEAALRDMQGREAHQQQLHEFEQREADRQVAREGGLAARQANTDQRNLAAEELNQRGQAAEGDKRTAMMAHLLANPDALRNVQGTGPDAAISRAIVNKMMHDAGVSASLPVDPKVAALARSKGLPEPQPQSIGGVAGQAQTGATTDGRPVSPYGTTLNVDAGKVYGMPHPQGTDINTNTGEFVPSDLVGTINGKPSTQAVAEGALKRGVSPEDTRSRGVYNALRGDPSLGANQPPPNEEMVANPVAGANVAGTSPSRGPAIAKTAQAPATPSFSPSGLVDESRPDIKGTERPGLETVKSLVGKSNDLGNIGQSLEPFTMAKNAVGSLFGGGQGGANQIVKQPTPQATPAPGTEFQGPVTATAGFLGQPNAPAPAPANTPPAIPPVNKPTPEEERRRMALQQ